MPRFERVNYLAPELQEPCFGSDWFLIICLDLHDAVINGVELNVTQTLQKTVAVKSVTMNLL